MEQHRERIAIIDLGTNTFHLLIAEIEGKEPKILHKSNQPVKLGERITVANKIIPEAFDRGVSCLSNFAEIIRTYEATYVKATATSAVRSALNGDDFVKTIQEKLGIAIQVIDGEREATLIHQGVKWSGAISGLSLIMDIGGGSTEFILCDEEKLIWKHSFEIGASRLMQLFFNSDPISERDQKNLENYLAERLAPLFDICRIYRPKLLIGSAGAFETYDQMINHNRETGKIAKIDLEAFRKLTLMLQSSTHQERSQMHNLIALRVDMIVMASLLTSFVIEQINISEILLSTYDLKMGVLWEEINQINSN